MSAKLQTTDTVPNTVGTQSKISTHRARMDRPRDQRSQAHLPLLPRNYGCEGRETIVSASKRWRNEELARSWRGREGLCYGRRVERDNFGASKDVWRRCGRRKAWLYNFEYVEKTEKRLIDIFRRRYLLTNNNWEFTSSRWTKVRH
jgi:hypothetical protein